jgi:multidrug efflux pump
VVSEDHSAPTFGISTVFHIGFRLEPQGRTGIAHLFEHQYRMVMEVAPEHAQGPEALDRLHVIANGQRIPLSAFSRYHHRAAPDRVSRWGQFASESISFELRWASPSSEGCWSARC